jgi:hypothetical protein
MNINLEGGGSVNTAFEATNAAKIMLNSHLILQQIEPKV